ncbi:MAG TPA: c-type cytochrome biogenesis protein CcsB [Solirubrobacteraceae bacterium]|nr:c-type cytochrome biogenesis protein CcsB [Solirubrobacteraceae bacterium]
MLSLSQYCVFAGIVAVSLALICYVLAFAYGRIARVRVALAAQGSGGEVTTIALTDSSNGIAVFGTLTTWLALAFLSAALFFRWRATGHGPFANMYEFSVAFAWGALVVNAYFLRRYRQWAVGVVVLPIALAMLLYATTIPSEAEPLVPALQNNLLLTVHVATAVIAYGAFAVAFAAAALYMVQSRGARWGLPDRKVLDDLSYRAMLVGFPFLTLTIVLGAVWADIAWGKYWSWDPKESASLVTWIVCCTYLHARGARGWRGKRAALLLMLVFAATLFTYFGNLFFGGLHSYG